MGQRLLLHVSLVACAGRMARLAPACAIAHARVVVHLLRGPRGSAAVTCVAIHCRSVKQLCFGDVIGYLCHGTAGSPLRCVASAVARLAGGGADYGMVHGDRRTETDLRFVAGVAPGDPSRHWNVDCRFAHRRR